MEELRNPSSTAPSSLSVSRHEEISLRTHNGKEVIAMERVGDWNGSVRIFRNEDLMKETRRSPDPPGISAGF